MELAHGSAKGFNVLVITLDTTRADRLGCYGRANAQTPTLDALSNAGIRFDDAGKPVGKEVFAEGWLRGRAVSGRPMDIKELADGSLLVSDDGAGLIYRIRYVGR